MKLLVFLLFSGVFAAHADVCAEVKQPYRCHLADSHLQLSNLKAELGHIMRSDKIRLRKVVVVGQGQGQVKLQMGPITAHETRIGSLQRLDLYAVGQSAGQNGRWQLLTEGTLSLDQVYLIYEDLSSI